MMRVTTDWLSHRVRSKTVTGLALSAAGVALEDDKGLDLRNVFSLHPSGNGALMRGLRHLCRSLRAALRKASRRAPHLCMEWSGSRPPATPVPDGYRVSDDRIEAAAWAGLLNAGGGLGPWDEQRLRLETARLVSGTQVFLTHGGLPVAGAGVYDRDPGSWEIGWIAVHPEHRRRGLGEAVTRLALDRALDLGPGTVLLYTEDHRLDALRLYLRLGFRPALRHRSHRRRWRSVADRLPSEAAAQVVSSLQAPHDPANPS
jgi:mycothiol synthase